MIRITARSPGVWVLIAFYATGVTAFVVPPPGRWVLVGVFLALTLPALIATFALLIDGVRHGEAT